jgi:pimeloyl-ACP methyl ester carboxylesterase
VLVSKWNAQDVFAGSAGQLREEKDFDRAKLAAALEDFSVADQFTDTMVLAGDFVWLAGDGDAKFRALLDEMRNAGFPGSFFPVPGAGHRLLQDAPAAVAAALDRLTA